MLKRHTSPKISHHVIATMFNWGGPAAKSSVDSGPANTGSELSVGSYSGSFIDSIKPEDSASNVGSSVTNSMGNLQLSVEGAGTANKPKIVFLSYHNSPAYTHRLDFDSFAVETKDPFVYVAGSVIKLHHGSNSLREFKSALHMQYLHIVDTHLKTFSMNPTDAKIDEEVTNINEDLFTKHVQITIPQVGKVKFFRNFKNLIVRPVVESVYGGQLPDKFFRSVKNGEDEPVSKAIFTEWLARE
jgi:hypothetical protein